MTLPDFSRLTRPMVMGVINITPDSDVAMSRVDTVDKAVARAQQMIADGAEIIDIGGEPTNPSLHPVVPLSLEQDRVLPVLEALVKEISVPISVDTSKAQMIKDIAKLGASIINDVRALREPGALKAASETELSICLMHMAYPHGEPTAENPPLELDNLINSITGFLESRVQACVDMGINKNRIMIDPGIGAGSFGKTTEMSLKIIKELKEFKKLDLPILVGLSRKTFIGKLLDQSIEDRLPASLAGAAIAVANGANIIRTHDVKQTVEAVKMTQAILEA